LVLAFILLPIALRGQDWWSSDSVYWFYDLDGDGAHEYSEWQTTSWHHVPGEPSRLDAPAWRNAGRQFQFGAIELRFESQVFSLPRQLSEGTQQLRQPALQPRMQFRDLLAR
jgi:hypothetical protein